MSYVTIVDNYCARGIRNNRSQGTAVLKVRVHSFGIVPFIISSRKNEFLSIASEPGITFSKRTQFCLVEIDKNNTMIENEKDTFSCSLHEVTIDEEIFCIHSPFSICLCRVNRILPSATLEAERNCSFLV